jgi:hypothetical protein
LEGYNDAERNSKNKKKQTFIIEVEENYFKCTNGNIGDYFCIQKLNVETD